MPQNRNRQPSGGAYGPTAPAGAGPGGRRRQQQEEEEARVLRNRKTSVRTRERTPEAAGRSAQAPAIQSRPPRSGVEVTRPTEDRFQSGPNVTGMNELDSNNNLPQNRNRR